jgi:hypothetical protein
MKRPPLDYTHAQEMLASTTAVPKTGLPSLQNPFFSDTRTHKPDVFDFPVSTANAAQGSATADKGRQFLASSRVSDDNEGQKE